MSFRAFKTSVLVIKETCQLILMMNDTRDIWRFEEFYKAKIFYNRKAFFTEPENS